MILDYNTYSFSLKEKLTQGLKGMLQITVVAYLFYSSFWAVGVLSPYLIVYFKKEKKKAIEKRKWELNLQFKDAIVSLSAALSAGYAIENAFAQALFDLKCMYSKDSSIVKEFQYMVHQLETNQTVEAVLLDFAHRSNIEDINNFTRVFMTAKRTGGDVIRVIKHTSDAISTKLEVKREIITMVTQKRFESNIMKFIPFGIILYLLLTSPGFLDPLYGNIMGVIIMSLLLLFYYFFLVLSEKILNIEF